MTNLFDDLLLPRGFAPVLAHNMPRDFPPQIPTLPLGLFLKRSDVLRHQIKLVHVNDDTPFLGICTGITNQFDYPETCLLRFRFETHLFTLSPPLDLFPPRPFIVAQYTIRRHALDLAPGDLVRFARIVLEDDTFKRKLWLAQPRLRSGCER